MRRPRPRTDWLENVDNATVVTRRAPDSSGRVLVRTADDDLPALEPLRRVRSVREPRGSDFDQTGLIIGDLADGRAFYPDPPPRTPSAPAFARLARRVSPAVVCFAVLAAIQSLLLVADAIGAGGWSLASVASLLMRVGYTGAITLLPAAVLIWRPDGWRSIRFILAGAVLWTTVPAVAAVGWWVIQRSPGLMASIGMPAAAAVALATVASYAGPAFVAFGLDRVRGVPTMAPGGRGLTVLAAVTLANATRWLAPSDSGSATLVNLDATTIPAIVAASAIPIAVLGLSMLAWSCLSAVLAEEVRARFWQCGALGAGTLASVALFEFMTGNLHGDPIVAGLAARSSDTAETLVLPALGAWLVLLAFASPVWSKANDAAWRRSAPDEVFAWGGGSQAAEDEKVAMTRVIAIAAGADHSLALDDSGHVAAWGNDYAGQIAVPDGLSGVIAVAAGDAFSLALRFDGRIVAWGANDAGQTSVPPEATDAVAIAAREKFALAVRRDGSVVGWGAGPGVLPVPADISDVAAVSAGERHCLALRRDGTVLTWGDNRYGQLDVPKGLRGVTAISAGGNFNLALCSDGTVVAWGDSSYGQLDVPMGLKEVVAISAGAFHAIALRRDGDIVSWGGGGQRVGEAVRPWRLIDFKAVAAGDGFSLAVRAA